MIVRRFWVVKGLALALGVVCTVLAVVVLPAWVRAAGPDLPPRPPTPQPTVRPPAKPDTGPVGASIELEVQFSDRQTASRWPALWTVVQWQDDLGRWHDVEGWRGRLDRMQGGLGLKTWWLADNLFGRGPFRWLVGQAEGGPPLARSESFYLPVTVGETMGVEVLLGP